MRGSTTAAVGHRSAPIYPLLQGLLLRECQLHIRWERADEALKTYLLVINIYPKDRLAPRNAYFLNKKNPFPF
jgi:hypothetical protein